MITCQLGQVKDVIDVKNVHEMMLHKATLRKDFFVDKCVALTLWLDDNLSNTHFHSM